MCSDDDCFLATEGIEIENNRDLSDSAYVSDNLFSGM